MISLSLLLTHLAGTAMTFVRHGETVANATGHYNARTLNTFSAKGKVQVANLTKRLAALPPFDLILVSPSERALRTISPYLKLTHRTATIWPLLYECCTGKKSGKSGHPPLKFGAKIVVPADIKAYFKLMPGHERLPIAPDYGQGLIQVAEAVKAIDGFSGKHLLLVGHSGQGGHFIHSLTGRWIKVENAKEISFRLPARARG